MCTTFECRADPTPAQAANLARTFGCVRNVWNETLAWRHARWHGEGLSTNVPEANAHLTAMKRLPEPAYRTGRHLVVIDRWYPSSKTCSHCGHLLAGLSLSTRTWQCPSCGTRHDRDENAAESILAAGLAVAREGDACGGDVRHSGSSRVRSPKKQELPAGRPRIPVLPGGE
jgi:transposase